MSRLIRRKLEMKKAVSDDKNKWEDPSYSVTATNHETWQVPV